MAKRLPIDYNQDQVTASGAADCCRGTWVMPELPEVETMRRGIEPIVGATIEAARRTPCRKRAIQIRPRPAEFQRRVCGRTIVRIDRLGKRVVVVLDDLQRIVFEPRMTGLVLIDQPPGREHLRFEICLRSSPVPSLLFWDRRGLGQIRLFAAEEFAAAFTDLTLGPDALQINTRDLVARLGHLKSPVKVALLDQRRLAGVGNLYAAEILHRAGIHPATSCRTLSNDQWRAVHRQMRHVLAQAIRCEGSTLSDGTYRRKFDQPGTYQTRHLVYDRAGQKCRRCRRGTILRIVQAQRATFYCPTCQPQRRSRRTS